MAGKRYSVVINGASGYSSYRVTANDWKHAEVKAKEIHKQERPDDPDSEIGCSAVIAGWPDIWC
ncbi:hypothetical protein [Klebsiella aerogenes]|uniref:hypothetical protein n=1 Tax=Klebsiella aerogenes TaxID=548 RepID=UPI0021759F9A|nr:hypothetical protein [Klebsiella aerogenes]UWC45393.1 hypothetical protein M5S98_17000 [Klebsiella aerogenes]HCJ5307336.1 hypothetical protein [Klebsiella aerogenes]